LQEIIFHLSRVDKILRMKYKIWGLMVTLVLCLPSPAAAQTLPLQIDNLLVEIWPEYDHSEVLVIYQATLDPTTPLPTEVTIPLPAYVDELHVVALVQNNALVEAPTDSFNLRREGNMVFLDLFLPVHTFQFEYYDPIILTREGETRMLTYQFLAPYPVKAATFEIQEPFQASQFTSTLAPTASFQGSDGLTYNLVQVENLAAEETFDLSATYQRNTDVVSTQNLDPRPASPPTSPPAATTNDNQTLGYVLIGVGAFLFLGAVGSWWWSRREADIAPTRPVLKGLQKGTTSTKTAGFCYRCGTALRREANFCHTCGAARRQAS
jgi:hypothetical protein